MGLASWSRRKQPQIKPAAASRRHGAAPVTRMARAAALLVCFSLLAGGSAAAAQKQKDKQQDSNSTGIVSPIPPSDSQAIDTLVSQMLGAWQVGDVDMMHKYYADDVTVVSGTWEPPLLGWANYARAFRTQRARTKGDRLERSNSYTKINGETAWCTYQWRYTGDVDGVPATAFGHTTLMLEKRAGNWLIVLNHTSVVPVSTPNTSTAAPQVPQAVGRVSGPGA
jgi:ketosteroid isomerase-like protein